MGSAYAIETENLQKSFGATRAVAGVDLTVHSGSIFAVLGPNGAGKTTTVRMLATLLRPDAGRATVLGHDLLAEPQRVRERIGLTGQFASLDENLTGRENLLLLSRLRGFARGDAQRRADTLLQAFGLAEAGGKHAKTYSGGMRRRLDIACSLIRKPELLFLDEPTTGLDPRSRGQVWEIVRALAASGATVLLTTQYLEEADQLADRIAVIDQGRLIAEGRSDELKARVAGSVLRVRLSESAQREAAARVLADALGAIVHVEQDARALSVPLDDPAMAGAALSRLSAEGISLAEFSLVQPSLDEVFFALTGHAAAPQNERAREDPA